MIILSKHLDNVHWLFRFYQQHIKFIYNYPAAILRMRMNIPLSLLRNSPIFLLIRYSMKHLHLVEFFRRQNWMIYTWINGISSIYKFVFRVFFRRDCFCLLESRTNIRSMFIKKSRWKSSSSFVYHSPTNDALSIS
jgi:hypothetical protein